MRDITCGVPQGSVLGPLLFIIYVNDLPRCLKQSQAIQFADDTTIYMSGKNKTLLYNRMNEELLILTDWFYANKLSLNTSKTNYMLFTRTVQTVDDPVIEISNEIIKKIIMC